MAGRQTTKTQEAYEKLEHLIVFCKIQPGSILTEIQIADMIGAGRTPTREALRMLVKDHLVTISRAGVMIAEMSGNHQLKLLEVRRIILKLCVECAIERLTPKDKTKMQEILQNVEHHNEAEFLSWLRYRHKVLADASKNQFIYEHLKSLQGLTYRFWYYYATQEEQEQRKKLHSHIIVAILEQNKIDALKAVSNLIDYLENFVKNHSKPY